MASSKIHFQNYFLEKDIFQIAMLENTFSKLLSLKILFQNSCLKKNVFKTAVSKNTSLKLFS